MAWSPPAHNAGIVWVSAPGDYATFNSNHTPDGTAPLAANPREDTGLRRRLAHSILPSVWSGGSGCHHNSLRPSINEWFVNGSSEPSRFEIETAGGGFQVREDEPAPRVGAGLHRTL